MLFLVQCELQGLSEQIKEKQIENDNLVFAMQIQSGLDMNRNLEGEIGNKVNELLKELLRTKQENAQMRLDLEVLADKINKDA